jgi:hypothetical protein
MTAQCFPTLVSAITGLAGTLIAGFSAWMVYRSRTSKFQEMVYERRARACEQLLHKLDDVRFRAELIVSRTPNAESLADDQRTELEALVPDVVELQRMVLRDVFLPSEVTEKLTRFIELFGSLRQSNVSLPQESAFAALFGCYVEVGQAASRSLKIDVLERRLLKFLGGPSS